MKKKWDLRNGASLSSGSDSDDASPEEGFQANRAMDSLSQLISKLDSDSPEPEPYKMSKGAQKAGELLKALDEFNDVTREKQAHSEEEEPLPPEIAAESGPPSDAEQSVPEKRAVPHAVRHHRTDSKFVDTVMAIHDFFQGEFSVQVILQAIHACAGDYRAATVKLSQGFTGCSLLEIPTVAGDISRSALRAYLRGS